MSTIGSNPPPIHPTGLNPAGGQVSFDDLRQQGLLQADTGLALPEAAPVALVDPGEAVLNLAAWGEGDASRALPRSEAFEGRLAGLDRGDAAGAGVDEILASL